MPSLMAAHATHPHLPADRSPGPQSRRRKSDRRFVLWLLPALAVVAFVAAAAFLTGAVDAESDGGIVGGIVFAVGGAGLVIAFVLLARARQGTGGTHLQVTGEPLELMRGDKVHARFRISDAAKVSGKVEVGLVCVVFYDIVQVTNGSRRRVTRSEVAWEAWQTAQPGTAPQAFDFSVPRDAPFSYEGTCLSLAWRLTAREDRPRRRDPHTNEPVWVRP